MANKEFSVRDISGVKQPVFVGSVVVMVSHPYHRMTIEFITANQIYPDGVACVTWFNDCCDLCRDELPLECLSFPTDDK